MMQSSTDRILGANQGSTMIVLAPFGQKCIKNDHDARCIMSTWRLELVLLLSMIIIVVKTPPGNCMTDDDSRPTCCTMFRKRFRLDA